MEIPDIHVRVLFDFEYPTKDGKKITIKEGEKLYLIKKTNEDWWQVIRNSGRPFYVPASYVEEISRTGAKNDRKFDTVKEFIAPKSQAPTDMYRMRSSSVDTQPTHDKIKPVIPKRTIFDTQRIHNREPIPVITPPNIDYKDDDVDYVNIDKRNPEISINKPNYELDKSTSLSSLNINSEARSNNVSNLITSDDDTFTNGYSHVNFKSRNVPTIDNQLPINLSNSLEELSQEIANKTRIGNVNLDTGYSRIDTLVESIRKDIPVSAKNINEAGNSGLKQVNNNCESFGSRRNDNELKNKLQYSGSFKTKHEREKWAKNFVMQSMREEEFQQIDSTPIENDIPAINDNDSNNNLNNIASSVAKLNTDNLNNTSTIKSDSSSGICKSDNGDVDSVKSDKNCDAKISSPVTNEDKIDVHISMSSSISDNNDRHMKTYFDSSTEDLDKNPANWSSSRLTPSDKGSTDSLLDVDTQYSVPEELSICTTASDSLLHTSDTSEDGLSGILREEPSPDDNQHRKKPALKRNKRVESCRLRFPIRGVTPPVPEDHQQPTRELFNGWCEYTYTDGRTFFYNSQTGEKSWKPPRRRCNTDDKNSKLSGSTCYLYSDSSSPLAEVDENRGDVSGGGGGGDIDDNIFDKDSFFNVAPKGYRVEVDPDKGCKCFVNLVTGAKDSATEIEHSNITPLSTTAMVNEDSLVEIGSSKTDSLLDLGYFTYSGGEDQELSSNKDTAENTISQSTHMPSDIEQSPEFSRDGETEENGTAQSINASPDVIKDSDPNLMKGCRIIDVMFYEEQMVQMNDHNSPFNCNFSHMQLINEIRYGLSFVRTFKCGMCGITNKLYSHRYLESTKKKDDESVEMNINEAAVAGTLIAGIGETALNHVLSALNIPTMSSRTFSKYREKVAINLENVAKDTMYKSAMKARAIAISKGREDKFGNALVPVIVDGAYCQRSYRTTYSSLGGCGVIIAAETGEVLYVGVKNKFCVICTKAKNKGVEPKKHTCHQNWGENRSSASMEAAAIVEGFLQSESMYKIRYYKMIADGDSSVYKSILDAHPYENLIVQKIECRNHLMRNFCSNITADCLTSSERNKEKCALKSYVLQKLPKLRIGIRKSIDHWSAQGITPQTIKGLERDLLNAASHVFGEHAKCAEIGYFCDGKPKPDEKNMVPSLKKHNIYQSVMERCDRLVNHSKSLLHNVTNNAVESFNAIIASKISGKRVNFTARDSYKARIHCAVLTSVGEPFRLLHKKSTKLSPGLYSKLIEKRTLQKRIGLRGHKKVKKQLFNKTPNDSADYGLAAAAPDLEPDVFQSSLLRKIEQIKENHKDIVQIELDTRGQSDSSLWYEIRRNLITASNVGSICKLKSTTSTAGTVNKILYSWFDNDNVKWGRDHEKVAIAAVEEHFELEIVPCGLFIHQNHYYIGASPDGLIGDDGIIEVKCPSKARDLSVTEGVAKGFIDCLDKETLELKKTSNYYYQVQAQMEVTNRSFCIFTVWTSVNWVVQSIPRDETFWNQKMPKLENFYFKSLLPELVDSRKRRSLPLRAINIEGIDIDKLPPIEKKKKPTASKKMKKEKPAQKKMKNEKPGLKKTKKETPALRESKRKLAPKKGIKEEPARPKIKKEKTPSVTVSTPLETATSKKNLKRKGTTSILPPIEKEKKQARTIKKRKTSCTKNLTPSSETSATSSGIDILFNSTCLKISSKPMIIQPKANQ